MKRSTIKWKIFKYNIIAILVLISLTTVIFNIAVRLYIERDITGQLDTIAKRAEDTALQRGPDFFPPVGRQNPPPAPMERNGNMPGSDAQQQDGDDLFRFYFMLDRSLREPLSVLNADYILLDSNKQVVTSPQEDYYKPSGEILNRVTDQITEFKVSDRVGHFHFTLSGTVYAAVATPVQAKNTFGLGWIVIFSSLQKINQLQWGINLILFAILLLSALIFSLLSSLAAKKISAPFSSLNQHIRTIAERNFSKKILLPVDDELQELISNINIMSGKLETYDKAQKTFLQNASHEFRTPLMSIQSYAEGIKYNVVEADAAAGVIIGETQRMTRLVEDLLFLSRLDAIEESYHFSNLVLEDLLKTCVERMNGIAASKNIKIGMRPVNSGIIITGDDEMLMRAVTNILNNCIRYASSTVEIALQASGGDMVELSISDDGPGFDANELPIIFDRFYKGKKGNFGLGLAIAKNVVDKHRGRIIAGNTGSGAIFKLYLPIRTVN